MTTESGAPPENDSEQLPPHVIEGARSGRSRCKTCRKTISKGALRLGILIEGPFGTGYLWHHLKCAARKQFHRVEQAYEQEAWQHAKVTPTKLPALEELATERQHAEERAKKRKKIPYAEAAPTGRARCKHCGEPIEKGSLRVVLGREVTFGSQVRVGPINVHPGCVAQELDADDCVTEAEELETDIKQNSELTDEQVKLLLAEIGEI